MSTRVTRRTAAKGPSLMASDKENHEQQPSSPPAMPELSKAKGKPGTEAKTHSNRTMPKVKAETSQALDTPVSATAAQSLKEMTVKKEETPATELEDGKPTLPAGSPRKRKRAAATSTLENDPDELPHNMGKRLSVKSVQRNDESKRDDQSNAKTGNPKKPVVKERKLKDPESRGEAAGIIGPSQESLKRKDKKVENFPCSDPYPDWAHPTPEECQIVHDLLMDTFPKEQHSRFIQPDTVPPPSEFVAGCGEVPTILDAMLRTLLSAATSKRNSSSAFQGLVQRFGLQGSGPCKGSVDWTAIRHATLDDVFQAIKTGGLARNKSKNIKAILNLVYSENGERCKSHSKVIKINDASAAPSPGGADPKNFKQMKGEIDLFAQDILTLDYYHLLSKDDALMAMQKYPGIGVKTAACVALFCMQKPCFAVDTHVFRLCRYLGWVPPKDEEVAQGEKRRPEVNEVSTFKHCEIRIPDNLKYGLHQLFWDHGNHCGRCRAITGETSEGWADANCPIEHLVKRYGEKKGGTASLTRKGGKAIQGTRRTKGDTDDYDEDIADVEDEEMELGREQDDQSHKKGEKEAEASAAKEPPKGGKATGAAKAGTASAAKAGKPAASASVSRAKKAKMGDSRKRKASE